MVRLLKNSDYIGNDLHGTAANAERTHSGNRSLTFKFLSAYMATLPEVILC